LPAPPPAAADDHAYDTALTAGGEMEDAPVAALELLHRELGATVLARAG
jgi:hypothetical protein